MQLPQPPSARTSRPAVSGFILIAVLLLGLPKPSLAQTVARADLVGMWAKEGQKRAYLTFKADSTFTFARLTSRWHLAGDTLVVDPPALNLPPMRRLVKLDGQRLTLTELERANPARVYVRITNTDDSWTEDQPLTGRALPCDQGTIKTFDCQNVELLAYLPKDSLGQSVGTDIWGWHDSTTGREFAILGGESTAFVEVTDPMNPKYLGILRPREGSENHAAQSVKVYKHYAFIGYESTDHGIQVFDLTQLRDVKSPLEFKETVHYDRLANTHTITLNQETGFAYVNGSNTCGGGLHMIDVRTPTKPTEAGCYTETRLGRGYVHDAQCVIYRGPDAQYKGREICVNYGEAGISIADVTDKQKPKTISIASYPNVGYTHQGWFTEDQRYIYLNDEGDEGTVGRTRTIGFDLNDLDDPVLLTEFLNTTTDTDHNLYIRGRYMYQGNYGAGLRIIDIADPKNLKEVGYLTNIEQTWGTYPFFKNDVVGVPTDLGLFLVRLQKRQTR